jgi:hypothetical protein
MPAKRKLKTDADNPAPEETPATPPAETPPAETPEGDPPPESAAPEEPPAVPAPTERYYAMLPAWMPEPPRSFPFPRRKRLVSVETPPDESDLAEYAKKQADVAFEIQRLEADKKAFMQRMKADLDALHDKLIELAGDVRGTSSEQVEAETVYEVSGFADGQWIRHPGKKCLVCIKTGVILRVEDMDEADSIAELPLAEGPAADETDALSLLTLDELEQKLEECPYGIMPDERDEAEHPWYAFEKDGPADAPLTPLVGVSDRPSAIQAVLRFPAPVKAESPAADPAADVAAPDEEEAHVQSMTCYDQGYDARCNNNYRNPYDEGDAAREAWQRGWNARDSEIEAAAAEQAKETDADADDTLTFDEPAPPPAAEAENQHFAEGRADYLKGVDFAACRYPHGTPERQQWRRGWEAEADKAK